MSPTDRVFADALRLPEPERAKLVHQLLESLDGVDEDVDQAWAAEIEKRAREVLDDKVELLDGPAVMAKLRALDEQ